MKPSIQATNISKRYRTGEWHWYHHTFTESIGQFLLGRLPENDSNFWALDAVSFKVMPGEILGVMGNNGAGKSTLLKILSRVTPPTKGSIKVRGRLATLLEVGTGFHPELTGRENIFLYGAVLGLKKKEITGLFDEIVAFSEVEKFLDTPIKRYSSGMQLRLAFSVAAHLHSDILLIDEVLAVGDKDFQKKCVRKMEQRKKEGKTILFVSHQLNTMQQFCDNGIVLEKGKIIFSGKVEDAIKFYDARPQLSKSLSQ
jgi:lipopolysaccharide transport system ATP-binding protein